MAFITFKNVGQGDSIIFEWEENGKNKIGIIDCALYQNQNPIVEYINLISPSEIEFVILTHFHYDHFSGFPDFFKFCFEKNIVIKYFLHTLSDNILQIYDKIEGRKKIENATINFFANYDLMAPNVREDYHVNINTRSISLSNSIQLKFLGPNEKVVAHIAKQILRKVNKKEFTSEDINKYSAITCIENEDECVILTSDAVRAHFRSLHKILKKETVIIQVPHHGSSGSLYKNFWEGLLKTNNCPAVFSVGYEEKDKLPDKETVEVVKDSGFIIHSTNAVFGIVECFPHLIKEKDPANYYKSLPLNCFSKARNSTVTKDISNSQFSGDQKFNLLN